MKTSIRASPTGEANKKLNLKIYTFNFFFLYFTTPTQQGKGEPKWLFNMLKAISTGFCRNS